MTSLWITKVLLVFYIFILGTCIYEKNWPKALYWGGAIMLLCGVITGMK